MTNPQIKFKCPKCEHDQLVQIMEQVTVTERLTGFFVAPSKSPGRKFAAESDFQGVSSGKVKQFQCGRCGYILMTLPRRLDWWQRQRGKKPPNPLPIKNTHAAYLWLKRHGMIIAGPSEREIP